MESGLQIQREIYDFLVVLESDLYLYTYHLEHSIMRDVEKAMQYVSQDLFRKKLYQKMVFLARISEPLQYLMA
jgi:hypothetical protein